MVSINKTGDLNVFTTWWRHVRRESLLSLRIELFPISTDGFNSPLKWSRVSGIHHNPSVGMSFEVREDVQGIVKVTLARRGKVRRQNSGLIQDVNSTQLNGPAQDANQLLIPIGVVVIQLRGNMPVETYGTTGVAVRTKCNSTSIGLINLNSPVNFLGIY